MTVPRDITLVLFDIDGTLLDTHGAGRQSFVNALASVFGWQDDIAYIRFAGATDLDVLAQIAARRGQALSREQENVFVRKLPEELRCTLQAANVTLYPGVRELLHALSADPRALLGLVTGNIESCARLKLASLALHEHFVLGAFGHEHANRNEIARLAVHRAEATLRPGTRMVARWLVGDTPSDVAAARAAGVSSIAVATGTYTAEQLRAAGADHVAESLADTREVLGWLGLDRK